MIMGIDVSSDKQQPAKAAMLRGDLPADLRQLPQVGQRNNPDAAITLELRQAINRLESFVKVYQGVSTGDGSRFVKQFWEVSFGDPCWEFFHEAPTHDGVSG